MLKTKNVRLNWLNIQAPDIGALLLIMYRFSNLSFYALDLSLQIVLGMPYTFQRVN